MNSIMKKIILGLVFLLPFVIFPSAFFPMVYARSMFFELVTLVLIALWIINKIYHREENSIPNNLPIKIFGIYTLFFLVSGLSGSTPSLSFWGSIDHGIGGVFMVILFLFTLILSSLFKNDKDWYKLFTTFVVSGIIFTIGGILSHAGFRFSNGLQLDIFSGFTIGNSSWTGIYTAFVLFISLGLAFGGRNTLQKIIGLTGVVFAFFDPTLTGFIFQAPGAKFGFIGLAQTGSYSIFFCFFLFVLYLIYRKIKSLKIRKIFIAAIASVIIISIVAILVSGLGPEKKIITDNAGPNRLVFWDIAVKGFKDKPILGWGSDTYQFVYAKYFNPVVLTPGYAPEFWVDRAHSYYFDELQAGGIIGFVGLISLYFVLLFGLIRKALNDFSSEGFLYMAFFAGLVSYMIQGLMIFQTLNGWFMVAIFVAFTSYKCFKNNENVNKNEIIVVDEDNKRRNILISTFVVLLFSMIIRYVVIIPFNIDKSIGKFPSMGFVERITFLSELDSAYMGNITDLGNVFAPYHLLLRGNAEKGLSTQDKKIMIYEINAIDKVLENGLKKSNYMEMKVLMSAVGMHSILVSLSEGAEQKKYYEEGIFYVEKMKMASPENLITKEAQVLLDNSLDGQIKKIKK